MFNNQGVPTTAVPPTTTAALVLMPTDCPHNVSVVRNMFLNTVGQIRIQNGNCP